LKDASLGFEHIGFNVNKQEHIGDFMKVRDEFTP
jgi:hypothetical protein